MSFQIRCIKCCSTGGSFHLNFSSIAKTFCFECFLQIEFDLSCKFITNSSKYVIYTVTEKGKNAPKEKNPNNVYEHQIFSINSKKRGYKKQ